MDNDQHYDRVIHDWAILLGIIAVADHADVLIGSPSVTYYKDLGWSRNHILGAVSFVLDVWQTDRDPTFH